MTRHKREVVGLTNERDFPHMVELVVPPEGLRDVLLQIDAFHRERRIRSTAAGAGTWPSDSIFVSASQTPRLRTHSVVVLVASA